VVDIVREVLAAESLAPSSLRLELTESALIKNPGETAPILAGLRALGVSLSLDDFGTGYSSLSYLHRFPLDVIKIDKSFVDGVAKPGERSLVPSIIRLAPWVASAVRATGSQSRWRVTPVRKASRKRITVSEEFASAKSSSSVFRNAQRRILLARRTQQANQPRALPSQRPRIEYDLRLGLGIVIAMGHQRKTK